MKTIRSKRLKVGDVLVDVVTVAALAEIVGKSKNTIIRYENDGVFPPCPLVNEKGVRYYPVNLCYALKPIVSRIPINRKCPPEIIVEINKLFNEERSKYAGNS